ncbi:MAG: AsmA family protein [Proteobacteria bacterium]|nr:AsmA family protein [Pseudomonadota bacterium]MBU4295049.1 AsmA family protein [Pseudomonadota bacterium]MCG2746599.1 AsmA family protein [Desulfobulbaceae bacterium]
MKTAIRVLAGIVVVVLLVIAGLSAFVHFYLTGDRLEAMLVPPVQKALGRDITLGRINVSLFQGITVDGFTVKEPDGKQDFASVGKFILRYDLMPLLQKKIVVSEIRLEQPAVRIFRDDKSHFNFSSLAVLAKQGSAAGTQATSSAPVEALPLALTVDKISVHRAHLLFSDAKGEMPSVDALADVNVGLDLAHGLDSLRFKGDDKFELTAVYQGLEPRINGTMEFSEQQLSVHVEVAVQDEKINIDSKIDNYLKTPSVELNAVSKQLNIDKLLAMAGALNVQDSAGKQGAGKSPASAPGRKKVPQAALAAKLPPGLTAHGRIEVEKATYQGLEMSNLHLVYRLEKNILTVQEFTADTAEGSMATNLTVDLNEPGLTYEGTLALKAVQLALLQDALSPQISEKISGALSTDVSYSGAGMDWSVLRDRLSADGNFSLLDGKILNSGVARSIADLLGLPELQDFVFASLSGNVRVSEGNLNLTSSMEGRDLNMEAAGRIGLDNTLDLPLTLQLSPELSQRLQQKASIARYLSNEQGKTIIQLKVAGTLDHPQPVLDTTSVQKQVGKTLLNKALGEIDRSSEQGTAGVEGDQQNAPQPSLEETGKSLLKGLLGK